MNFVRSYKLAALAMLFSSILAHASAMRTYVSVNGSDANTASNCSTAAPCRSFGAALGVTVAYGEVIALDSGDYDPFTVTQSVTVAAAPGVDATILDPFGGSAVTISAGANDLVILRGLNLNGFNLARTGILFTGGGVLCIENVTIAHFEDVGIDVDAAGALYVKDTEVQDTFEAIRLFSSAGTIHASLDRVRLEHSVDTGLFAIDNSQTTIRNSIIAGNQYGIQVETNTAPAEVNVDDCVIQNSSAMGIDVESGGPAVVRVNHSTIVDNAQGLNATFSAQLLSYGNNRLAGNGTDGSFTGLIALQ